MRRLIEWIASKLPPPRIIKDRNGTSPYLSRYYIVGSPSTRDGSTPFNDHGVPRENIVWPSSRFGVYLHHFHRGDDEQELHNHPWEWAVSLVLAGGYIEERRVGRTSRVICRIVRPWTLNWIMSDDFHRVQLMDADAWSLFVVGPKFSSWGFWNRRTGEFTPWRQFITQLRDPASFARPS